MNYWDAHYRAGGTSGLGSRGDFALMKRDLINQAIKNYDISDILELGSGDGYVANLIEGVTYFGLDPSAAAVALARKANTSDRHMFDVYPAHLGGSWEAHLSQDVIRHLMSDEDLDRHLADLFSAQRVVMVWSSDVDHYWSPNEMEHNWTPLVPEGWRQVQQTPIPGINSNFYVYLR